MSRQFLKITGTQSIGVKLTLTNKQTSGVDYGGSGLFWCSIPIKSLRKLLSGKQKRIKVRS